MSLMPWQLSVADVAGVGHREPFPDTFRVVLHHARADGRFYCKLEGPASGEAYRASLAQLRNASSFGHDPRAQLHAAISLTGALGSSISLLARAGSGDISGRSQKRESRFAFR